jgi:hypothetical protein
MATLSAACTGVEVDRITQDNAKATAVTTGFIKALTDELFVGWIRLPWEDIVNSPRSSLEGDELTRIDKMEEILLDESPFVFQSFISFLVVNETTLNASHLSGWLINEAITAITMTIR